MLRPASPTQQCRVTKEDALTYVLSLANHTVEKCPQPNFRTMIYRPLLNSSPMFTG